MYLLFSVSKTLTKTAEDFRLYYHNNAMQYVLPSV